MLKTFKAAMEKFAKAMVQPLMYVSVAGIVLAVGALITNSTITSFLPFLKWGPIQTLGKLMYECIMVIINNLAVLFVIGIPAAFAKKEKHQAAIIGFLSYWMYLVTSNIMLKAADKLADPSGMLGLMGTGQTTILGLQVIDMSVFGGILLGCIVGYVFNKTSSKRFKNAFLQIYSGANFSFLIMIFVSMGYGVISNLLWPFVQIGISSLAGVIKNAGTFGLFIFGFLERLLIPTGLHHLVYIPFQFTELGGVLQLGDTTVAGAYPIYLTERQAGLPFSDSIYYMNTGFVKMFGYIGIALAFIYTAKPENKNRVKATMLPLAITSCIAGITEPIDFMFIFAAPVLYVLHAALSGLFMALMKIFSISSFAGSNLITSTIMNIAGGYEQTKWPWFLLLGVIQIAVYFFLFTFLIKKFNMKTPGRETEEKKEAVQDQKIDTKNENKDNKKEVATLIEGLGGKENINSLENCFTRLRINVKDPTKINEEKINVKKNSGIVKKDNDIQIVYGLQVAEVRQEIEEYIEKN